MDLLKDTEKAYRVWSATPARGVALPRHLDKGLIPVRPLDGSQAGRIDSSALTARERQLLAFLVEGQSNKVITRKLGVAEATVKAQMVRLFTKIGAANRTQAAVLAWASHRASPHQSSRPSSRSDLNRAS